MNLKFKKGIYLALGTAMFSGVANFVNKFALSAVGDPLVHTTLKNSLVAMIMISILVFSRKFEYLRKLSKRDILALFAIGVVGGSLPFYLFFTGLSQIPAINAALIHKTLIFWVAILAIPLFKERVSIKQIMALGLIFSSNLIVGGFKGFSFSTSELMVLAATIFWSVENFIAKLTLRRVDPDIVVAARMGFGSVILLSAISFSGKIPILVTINMQQFGLIFLTSIILFGYVSTWYRALKLLPVTLVATVLTLATVITNGLSAIFITKSFNFEQFTQIIFIIAGVWFFTTSLLNEFKNNISSLIQKHAI